MKKIIKVTLLVLGAIIVLTILANLGNNSKQQEVNDAFSQGQDDARELLK